MPATIKINGDPYPLPDNFTFREMHVIKRMTGLRAGEIYPALMAGDTDVAAAFALTALRRQHPRASEDEILDLPLDEVVIDFGEEEESDERPPAGGVAEPGGE